MTNDTSEYMRQLKHKDGLAVATTIERVRSSRESMAYCFDHLENFYEYPLSILMRTDFPLSNELNEFIQQASSNGFLSIWLKQNQFEWPIDIENDENEFQSVTVDTIFYLLAFFFVFSFALLLFVAGERFVYEKVRCENSSKIWRYIEIAIDPHRYFLMRDLSY